MADEHYPGDTFAALDPADYPSHWTAEQRVGMYWYAMKQHVTPRTTDFWERLAKQRDHEIAYRLPLEKGKP